MIIKTKIQKWGNSLALRISGPIKSIPNFSADMPVVVEVTDQWIKVSPERKTPKLLKESDLLKNITMKDAHTDEVITLTDDEWDNNET